MKNINLVKGMLALLFVQLFSTSMLYAVDVNNLTSNNTRGVPIDKVKIVLKFSEQTTNSVKVSWDPVAAATNYLIFIDGGASIDLGAATEYVISRTSSGVFSVKVEAWKGIGADDILGQSEVVRTTTVVKAPGYAISWDEVNSISTSLKTPKRVISNNSDFTIEFWIKAEAIENGIFNISTGGGFSMKIEDDGDLLIYDGADLLTPVASASAIIDLKDPSNPPVVAPPPALPPTQPPHIRDGNQSSWQHIAITYENLVGYTIYKDGEIFEPLKPTTIPNVTWSDLKIENIKGQLDELRIWDVARSASEIKASAFLTVDNSISNLKVYYRFDQPAGAAMAIDLTGNGYDSDIDKGTVAEIVVPSYAMVRPITLAAYNNTAGTAVVVYWKDSTMLPLPPRQDLTKSIYAIYVTETQGDYSTLIGGGPFVIQTTLGSSILNHAFAATELDPAKTYYMKIAMEDKLSYNSTVFTAVQSCYSSEIKYDPGTPLPTQTYDGPENSVVFETDVTYAMVGSSPASKLGGDDFTIETWFKPTQSSGVILASKNSHAVVDNGWSISLSVGVPVINMSDGATQVTVPAGNDPVELNQWNHVAFVRENGVVTPYFNTIAQPSVNSNLDLSWTGGLSFGNYNVYDVNKSFTGELDEIRVFNASRSATEISSFSIIPASLDISDPNFSLVAYYKCNRDVLSVLEDEFGANATVFGEINYSKAQSEAMGCPMAKLADRLRTNRFDANWIKPTVITTGAMEYYMVETSNGPLFSSTGSAYYSETQVDDLETENVEVENLAYSQSAYFCKVSTIYNLGVDTNGDGVRNEDDFLKRFSKTMSLELDLKKQTPGNCYVQTGTSMLTSEGVSEIPGARGIALTTSVWFRTNVVAGVGVDLKDILRIKDTKNNKNRLRVRLHEGQLKVQTDGIESLYHYVTILPKRWYALTVVWEHNQAAVYIDGMKLGVTPYGDLSPGESDAKYVLESDFIGSLDDLKIWKRSLTLQEIKDYMNFEIEGPSTDLDLIAYHDFNISRGPYSADLSQNGVELEIKDGGALRTSYALGCPIALPFEDIDYNKFSVAWNETVDWGIGPDDNANQNYDYDLDFRSKAPDGSVGISKLTNVVATSQNIVGKLLYLVTSLDTSEPEILQLNPDHQYYCTVSRFLSNPFTGQDELRSSVEISSKLRSEAPGECLNLLGDNDTLTLPATLGALGANFTIDTWVKFGPPTEQRYSFKIDALGVVSREVSDFTRSFVFNGTDDGTPFLAVDWLIDDFEYYNYIDSVFNGIQTNATGLVTYYDLNGTEDPSGGFIKSIYDIEVVNSDPVEYETVERLMKVEAGVVSDSEFGYKVPVALGGRIVVGFKNGGDESQYVMDGRLADYDINLGLDENGSIGGEIAGKASESARWYNLTMTYDLATLKVYVDGIDTTLSVGPNGTYDPTKNITTLGEGFNGFIEEFRIWDQVHGPELLKAQRYSELDITGVELVDPAERAEAEDRRLERNGLSNDDFSHLTCYLPFASTHAVGTDKIKSIGFLAGEATIISGEDNLFVETLENLICRTYYVSLITNNEFSDCRYFPCIRMSYNSRSVQGSTITPNEDLNAVYIKSGMTLKDENPAEPGFYNYSTDINPHQTTDIEGRSIPTRYLSVMWGLADPELKSKQVTQQSWFIDRSGLTETTSLTVPDPDGGTDTYHVPLAFTITFDMKAISPEVYDINYTGPDTTGMTEAQKQGVRDQFDALTGEDFQLLMRSVGGPVKTPNDVYFDLSDEFPVPDPEAENPPSPSTPVITPTKIGSEGTRAGDSFTVTFSGVPRLIENYVYSSELNEGRYFYSNSGYFALGMSVSLNDMILTPVTGLVSDIAVEGSLATVSWSVVTESGVKQYLLEKLGADGKWVTVSSLNSNGSLSYTLQDVNHLLGDEYRITTIDVNGLRQAFAIGSSAQNTAFVTLNTGWNLISVPLNDVDLSVMKDLTVGKYWKWDGQSYQELVGSPQALEGIWVHSLVNNFPVKVTGFETDQDYIDLTSGWNLKGPQENMYFDDQAITVYAWTNENEYVRVSEAVNQIVSGHGYWIFNPDDDKTIPLQETPID